jgi:hypothetical protein
MLPDPPGWEAANTTRLEQTSSLLLDTMRQHY